jgi:hypothetical protein
MNYACAALRATSVILLFVGFNIGCGRMLDGTIYSIDEHTALFDVENPPDDAVIMPMQIETSYGYGKMTAQNPKTGERFSGTYSGVRDSNTTQAKAIATLVGDQGTVLDCVIRIQTGLQPHGMGTAKDKNGRRYRIQF